MFNYFPHNFLIKDLFPMIFMYTKGFRSIPGIRNHCQISDSSIKEMIKDAYTTEVQLADSKFEVSNILHITNPAICLENTTDTKSTSIVFNRQASNIIFYMSTVEHMPHTWSKLGQLKTRHSLRMP